jgi:hypothetical protein
MACLGNHQYVLAPRSAIGCRRRTVVRLARRPGVSVSVGGRRETRWKVSAAVAMALPSHCVVDTGGGVEDSNAYYNYSFSADQPSDAGDKVLESAGVHVYMTEAALQAKRVEPDAAEAPPAPEMEEGKEGEEEKEDTIAETVEPNTPAAPVTAPDMPHCVVEAVGSAAYQYMFTKERPAAPGAGAPTFESAGVSVYATESALEAKRAEIVPERTYWTEPPAPEPAVKAAVGNTAAATAVNPATPTAAAVNTSPMRHCLVSSPGADDDQPPVAYYAFSESKPAGVDSSPDAESAGVSLYYMMEALKTVDAASTTFATTVAQEEEPAPEEEEEEFVDAREEFEEEDRAEYLAQLSRALRTVDAANITFATVAQVAPAPVKVVEPTPVDVAAPAPVEMVDPAPVVEVAPAPVEVAAPAPVVEVAAPSTPAATPVTSRPAATMSALKDCGKSGAAVFERGSGIAAWQGLEIGYELDLVLEVPATPAAADIVSQPADNVGPGPMRSGAAVFANGVGVASWQEAQLDPPVTSPPPQGAAQPAAPTEDVAAAMASAMAAAMAAAAAPPDSSPAAPAETVAAANPPKNDDEEKRIEAMKVRARSLVASAASAVASPEPPAAVTSDVKETSFASGVKETSVASGKKKTGLDMDMKVQVAIWAACVAFVVYRFVFAPA